MLYSNSDEVTLAKIQQCSIPLSCLFFLGNFLKVLSDDFKKEEEDYLNKHNWNHPSHFLKEEGVSFRNFPKKGLDLSNKNGGVGEIRGCLKKRVFYHIFSY